MKREKVEVYPDLVHNLTVLSQEITTTDNFLVMVPSGDFRSITSLLESLLICYGIESDVELPMQNRNIEKGKGH